MFERIGDARGIVKIAQTGLAIGLALNVNKMNGRAGGAVIDAGSAGLKVVFGILSAQRKSASRFGYHILDECARDAYASVVALDGAAGNHRVNTALRCVRNADGLESLKGGFVDALAVFLCEGEVVAALNASAHGLDVFGKRSGSKGLSCSSSSRALGAIALCFPAHMVFRNWRLNFGGNYIGNLLKLFKKTFYPVIFFFSVNSVVFLNIVRRWFRILQILGTDNCKVHKHP